MANANDWYDKAANAMVRNGKSLFQWTNENNKGLKKLECDEIAKTPEFMLALRTARNKYYKELATDPTRSRNTAVGQLLYAVERLMDAGLYDKAVAALSQLFKVEGWSNDQTQVNIFQDLNAKDIEALRKKIKAESVQLPN